MSSTFLCLGTTPAAQRVMRFRNLHWGEVNRAAATFDGVAGKSINAAKVLHALGEQVLATGFLGGERGRALQVALNGLGLAHEFILVDAPTRQCLTVIDESRGEVTECVEESQPVPPAAYEQLLALVRRRLAGCRALVLSGTLPPGGPLDFYGQCTRLAHAAGTRVILDATGAALQHALASEPDVVKPNARELEACVGRTLPDEASRLAAMRELLARGARAVVVTAGAQPTLAVDAQAAWRIVPTPVNALNPIGSGDAFAALLAARGVAGDSLGEACRWAAAAGAANALTWMPGELRPEDLEALAKSTLVSPIR